MATCLGRHSGCLGRTLSGQTDNPVVTVGVVGGSDLVKITEQFGKTDRVLAGITGSLFSFRACRTRDPCDVASLGTLHLCLFLKLRMRKGAQADTRASVVLETHLPSKIFSTSASLSLLASMAPKKKKNRHQGSKSKMQPGSSSGTVPSPPQDSPPVTTELHDEATTSQEPTSSAAPEGATPASPPVASVVPHSRSQGEEEVEERGVDQADPQMASLVDSVDNLTVDDEDGMGWLQRGLTTLGSTFPELRSMTRELDGLPDDQESQELMADLTESLVAVANIFGGYTTLVRRTVRILQQERRDE
ncbi:hypothetical protein MUK42_15536 [Musa troglodytarum]|uniref:Uncharacterized protein n=1 Tax=Musa troglodytarum TaxID=320322 RepID=A0A9E7KZ90_9LILI|nr:hypothetical protein MUK42_15536 [Musa troglodytarum]